MLHIDQMHGPGDAMGDTIALPIQFRHHPRRRPAFGQKRRMAAIGHGDNVFLPQRIAEGDGNRFLANGQVDRALDLVAWVDFSDDFLHPADQPDSAVKPGRKPMVDFLHHGFSSTGIQSMVTSG